jgi:hypothetical protein
MRTFQALPDQSFPQLNDVQCGLSAARGNGRVSGFHDAAAVGIQPSFICTVM